MARLLGVILLTAIGACSSRVASTPPGGIGAGVSVAPPCASAAESRPTAPACNAEVLTCDPLAPAGLPVGACEAGATCDVTARFLCACADEAGPRFPYRCACAAGTWECKLDAPDARTCSNACLDAGTDAPTDVIASDAGPPSDGGACPKPKALMPPGPRVVSASAPGAVACAGKTLGDVIAAIYAAKPALADIKTIFDPATTMFDGSYIHAFAPPEGGFAIVFKRGGGDCPAGCTENEYWYFRTDAACVAKEVGHYHPGAACGAEGAPMWTVPAPLDPLFACGADKSPQDISGTHVVCASGFSEPCADKGPAAMTPIKTDLQVIIAQNPADRSKGTVVVKNSGDPRVDGLVMDATFQRRRFVAGKSFSNLPAKCPNEWWLSMELDFEGFGVPRLTYRENKAVGCSEASGGGSYCKGFVGLDLSVP